MSAALELAPTEEAAEAEEAEAEEAKEAEEEEEEEEAEEAAETAAEATLFLSRSMRYSSIATCGGLG